MPANTPTASEQLQKEAIKVTVPEGPKQQTATELLQNKLRQEGARQALEDAKKNLPLGVDQLKVRQNANSSFYDSDPTLQLGKRNEFVNAANKHSDFLKTPYDALPDASKRALRAKLGTEIQGISYLSELNNSFADQAARDAFADNLLKDPAFRARANRRLHEVSSKKITEDDKKARWEELKKSNPHASFEDAAGQLEAELQRDMNNVVEDTFRITVRENLEAADKVTKDKAIDLDAETTKRQREQGKQTGDGVAKALEKKWSQKGAYDRKGLFNRNGGDIQQDFDKFTQGGLEGLFGATPTAEQQAILADPDLKAKYEEQIGQSLVLKRLRAGTLKQEDLYRVVDAEWMGKDQGARIAKLTDIITNHSKIKGLLEQGQADGWLQDKNGLIDKLKDPKNAGATLGVLAAILMALALGPLAGGIAIPAAMAKIGGAGIIGAGAGALGAAKASSQES